MASTTHFEEIPGRTQEKIYALLSHTVEVLKHRGDGFRQQEHLDQIPAEYHQKLNKVLQCGAVVRFYKILFALIKFGRI